ncbi:MAG: BspA family leucine-rich repeat surface protein [Bacilli bacterium]|nr:BspA family leucine-rich repeat surface protein [Bacilli bacterium]
MKKGFTLMELLVVIAIIAVVSIASTVSFSNIDDATNTKELENKYIEIQRAASLYMDLHSDRLTDFVKDNHAYIPLSILEQEGYLTEDLSDPTGGDDISKNYSVKVVIGDDLESVETCIVSVKKEGDVCIANKFGKKVDCCSISSTSLADSEDDYIYEETEQPPVIDDTHTGITKFDKGRVVNSKIKSLVAGRNIHYNTNDNSVTGFKYASSKPSGFQESENNTVSPLDESYDGEDIYIWYDNGTIYFYSAAKNIYLNADGYSMFCRFNALKDISGLSHVKADNVESLQNFFISDYSLEDLSPLKDWNVSKVKSLRSFINIDDTDIESTRKAGSIKTLEPLSKWNVKSVIDMKYAFQDQPKLKNLKGLENWKTDSLVYLDGAFAMSSKSHSVGKKSSLTDISALKDWNVSNVKKLYYTFCRTKLTSLNGLQKWNVENVESMSSVFYDDYYLTNISALSNWRPIKTTNMTHMFGNNVSLSDISALQNWNVKAVKNFKGMFNTDNETIHELKKAGSIKSFAPLANWEPQSAEDLYIMFQDQIKANDYSLLNSWKPYLTHVTNAGNVFGISTAAVNDGFACSNQLAELRNTLDWPTSVTSMSNFYNDIDRCSSN